MSEVLGPPARRVVVVPKRVVEAARTEVMAFRAAGLEVDPDVERIASAVPLDQVEPEAQVVFT